MRTVFRILIKVCLCAGLLFPSCSRTKIIEIPERPETPLTDNRIVISGVKGLPEGTEIAYLKANITGLNWKIIGTVEALFFEGKSVITLPGGIPAEQLSKVGRDHYTDIMGFWPAEEVSDRDAKVAGLGDFIVYNSGDERVGRIFLSDWDRTGTSTGKYIVYYHYADRPFTLGGYNLTSPFGSKSFIYSASFAAGWNAYAIVGAQESEMTLPSLLTTDIPDGKQLFWRFESGVG